MRAATWRQRGCAEDSPEPSLRAPRLASPQRQADTRSRRSSNTTKLEERFNSTDTPKCPYAASHDPRHRERWIRVEYTSIPL